MFSCGLYRVGQKKIPLVHILHCTRGITFLAHPVDANYWGEMGTTDCAQANGLSWCGARRRTSINSNFSHRCKVNSKMSSSLNKDLLGWRQTKMSRPGLCVEIRQASLQRFHIDSLNAFDRPLRYRKEVQKEGKEQKRRGKRNERDFRHPKKKWHVGVYALALDCWAVSAETFAVAKKYTSRRAPSSDHTSLYQTQQTTRSSGPTSHWSI